MIHLVSTYLLYGIAAIFGGGSIGLLIAMLISINKQRDAAAAAKKTSDAEPTIAAQVMHTPAVESAPAASPFNLNRAPQNRREAKSLFAFQQKADNDGITLDAGIKEEASRENMLDQE